MNGQNVVRLIPAQARKAREVAQRIAAALEDMPEADWPAWERQVLSNRLYLIAADGEEPDVWTGGYVMLSPKAAGIVWDAIRELPANKRPQEVRHAFDLALQNIRWDTGEVMLRRDQLAELMKCTPDKVSKAMAVLAEWHVIRRETMRVEGMKGRGIVTYFMNPHLAWRGKLTGRADEARQTAPGPLLQLMQGGKGENATG